MKWTFENIGNLLGAVKELLDLEDCTPDNTSARIEFLRSKYDCLISNINSSDTIENYWECECKDNFIHDKTVRHCFKCNSDEQDQPDARLINLLFPRGDK